MAKNADQVCIVKGWQDAPTVDESTLDDDLSRHFYYTLGRDKAVTITPIVKTIAQAGLHGKTHNSVIL